VEHLLHSPIIALAELSLHFHLVHIDLDALTIGEIDAIGVKNSFRRKLESSRWIPDISAGHQATHIILPKSVNLLPSGLSVAAPFIPLNVIPPGGPLRPPIPPRPPTRGGGCPIPPGALAPIPIAAKLGRGAPPALLAASPKGPDAGPGACPGGGLARAADRRRADIDVAPGLGPFGPLARLAGPGPEEREAAIYHQRYPTTPHLVHFSLQTGR
jgi:hypothetical protein